MGIEVCELLANAYGNFQVMMAVYINTNNLHIHYVVNTTDYLNGNRFNLTRQRLYEIKKKISCVLEKYNLRSIRGSNWLE